MKKEEIATVHPAPFAKAPLALFRGIRIVMRFFAANFAHYVALGSCICSVKKMCKRFFDLGNAWLNCYKKFPFALVGRGFS